MAKLNKITHDAIGRLLENEELIECYCCFDRGFYYVMESYGKKTSRTCSCKKGHNGD